MKSSWLKLVIFFLVTAAVLILRFFVLNRPTANIIIISCGYWIVFIGVLLYLHQLYYYFCAKWHPGLFKKFRLGIAAALLGAVYLQLHEPRQFKVLFDEFTISGVSRNMHYSRQAAFPTKAHYIDDRMVVMESGIDRRPLFFQFVLACVHDVTGYRPENVFLLNGVVAFFLLLGTYYFGARYGGPPLGVALIGLWLSLPLLAQCATGGGYDIFNILMLLVLWYFGCEYLSSGTLLAQNLVVLSAIHLAQVRYESILYLGVVVTVLFLKAKRDRSLSLGWLTATSPLGLFLPLIINLAFISTPGAFQTNPGEAFFDLKYFPGNLGRAIFYLFDWGSWGTNSVILSIVGVIAIVAFLVKAGLRWRTFNWYGDEPVLGAILVIAILNVVLVLCNFWGQWDDPVASRFSLPLQLMFVLFAGIFLRELLKAVTMPLWISITICLCAVVLSSASTSSSYATRSMLPGREYAWFFKEASKPEHKGALIVAHPVGPIIFGFPSIGTDAAESQKWKVAECLRLRLYPEILSLERYCIDVKTGREQPYSQAKDRDIKALSSSGGETALSDVFIKETVAEIHWRPGVFSRIVRIVGVSSKPEEGKRIEQGNADNRAKWSRLQSVLP